MTFSELEIVLLSRGSQGRRIIVRSAGEGCLIEVPMWPRQRNKVSPKSEVLSMEESVGSWPRNQLKLGCGHPVPEKASRPVGLVDLRCM